MAQPYDLSGFVGLTAAVNSMLADQTAGRVKFAGGNQRWLTSYGGSFNAILAVGGSATATTTNSVRALFTTLRTCFDILASGSGATADIYASQAALNYTPPLITGSSAPLAFSDGATSTASTSYDLSGLAALQATANQMLTDVEAATTHFVDSTSFLAITTPGGAAQSTTMPTVRKMLSDIRATFDILAQ